MIKNRWSCSIFLLHVFLLVFIQAEAQLQKIYLHPKAAGSEKQSQFVDSIRFIPLEVKEDVRIGNYNNITVTANHFLIIDYPEKNILLYSREGKFVKRISYKKLGENFYPAYHQHTNRLIFFGNNKNYALTAKDRIKIMLDWGNPRNKKYFKKYAIDLSDSSFAIQKQTPTVQDVSRANHFFDDYYWQGQITTSPLYKDSLDYELKLYRNHQLVKQFFPYNSINEPRFLFTEAYTNFNKTDTPFVHMVTRPYCDTVYRMVNDSLFPAYQLVLPFENSLPASFYSQPFKNKTDRENFERNNGWMFRQVYNFYETPRFIFFVVGYFSNAEAYLYQKQTNQTIKAKNIRPDSSQYNLSLLGDFSFERKGSRFYKTRKAGELLSFFDQHKTVPVPKELQAFFNTNPHKDAQVIVEYKLKN